MLDVQLSDEHLVPLTHADLMTLRAGSART
jgi:hypothetical protein